MRGAGEGSSSPQARQEEDDEEEIEDLLYSLLTRKEVSVSWKDTSIPHLLGYGSVLYVVEQLLMYPSDLLKTRLQVDLRPESNLSKDWWVLCKHIYKHEGWRGFFRGFAFNTFGGIPGQLAFLITYNSCKEKVADIAGDSPIAPLVAGAMAEGLTAGFWVPLDVIVQRMQIQGGLPDRWAPHPGGGTMGVGGSAHVAMVHASTAAAGRPVFKGALGVIKDVVREDGVLGLWRGMGAHLASFMPQAAVWWASYEESKSLLARHGPASWQGMPGHFLAGISAGVVNSIVTNPLDTMKVRVQTKVGAGSSAFNCLYQMVRREGLTSLGKGLAPKILMAAPVSALSGVCYELVMSLSKIKREPGAPAADQVGGGGGGGGGGGAHQRS